MEEVLLREGEKPLTVGPLKVRKVDIEFQKGKGESENQVLVFVVICERGFVVISEGVPVDTIKSMDWPIGLLAYAILRK